MDELILFYKSNSQYQGEEIRFKKLSEERNFAEHRDNEELRADAPKVGWAMNFI